jgi:ribosomal protein L4
MKITQIKRKSKQIKSAKKTYSNIHFLIKITSEKKKIKNYNNLINKKYFLSTNNLTKSMITKIKGLEFTEIKT